MTEKEREDDEGGEREQERGEERREKIIKIKNGFFSNSSCYIIHLAIYIFKFNGSISRETF